MARVRERAKQSEDENASNISQVVMYTATYDSVV